MSEPRRLRMNILVDEGENPELYARLSAIHNDKLRARTLRQLAHERLVFPFEKAIVPNSSMPAKAISHNSTEPEILDGSTLNNRMENSGVHQKSIPKLPKGFPRISIG